MTGFMWWAAHTLNVDIAALPFILAGAIIVAGFTGDGIRALIRKVQS